LSHLLLAPVDVIVDSREDSKHPDFRRALSMRGLRVSVQPLPAGDFLLLAPPDKQCILVERKTVDDLANSIRDNRIWEQSKLLREAAEKDGHQPLIVVEGWIGALEKYRGWKMQSVLRVLDTLMLDFKIPVLNTPNAEATIEWIVAKSKSLGETKDKRVLRMRVEKKPMDLNERILYVVEGLAGPTIARRLLSHFKTIRNLANATVSDLLKVEGIGEKRAQEIYAVLNTPWRES